MNRDWTDFKSLYGNMAGAREAFEDACETLYRKKHSNKHVSQMRVKQGDGGIDIFIGEFGVEPITVIQCKFFLEPIGASQKSQIRNSFETAITSDKYELKEWILCVPRVIDIDENSWWFKWKHKQIEKHSKDESFIKLTNGNALIDLLKDLDLYNQVFKITDSLKISEIHNAVVPKKIEIPNSEEPSRVLFNNYTSINEQYYLERTEDVEFKESLKLNNIWLYGKSGAGKTALINRNLIKNKIEYCYCDLSPVTITESNDVINEILYIVEDKFDISSKPEETNILKKITQLLCDSGSNETVIVIDELSVNDEKLLEDIANKFIQLVTHFNNYTNQDGLRFVVSTISNPNTIVKNKSKACDYFQYMHCNSWDIFLPQLFDVLSVALNLDLEKSKELIIKKSDNSPRTLKAIFKKIIIYGDLSEQTIERAIKTTLEELV